VEFFRIKMVIWGFSFEFPGELKGGGKRLHPGSLPEYRLLGFDLRGGGLQETLKTTAKKGVSAKFIGESKGAKQNVGINGGSHWYREGGTGTGEFFSSIYCREKPSFIESTDTQTEVRKRKLRGFPGRFGVEGPLVGKWCEYA